MRWQRSYLFLECDDGEAVYSWNVLTEKLSIFASANTVMSWIAVDKLQLFYANFTWTGHDACYNYERTRLDGASLKIKLQTDWYCGVLDYFSLSRVYLGSWPPTSVHTTFPTLALRRVQSTKPLPHPEFGTAFLGILLDRIDGHSNSNTRRNVKPAGILQRYPLSNRECQFFSKLMVNLDHFFMFPNKRPRGLDALLGHLLDKRISVRYK